MYLLARFLLLLSLTCSAFAQFQFFDQMFGGGGGGGGQRQHNGGHEARYGQAQPGQQEAPSDSDWYRDMYKQTQCSKYLCPHTLSCVHFPHHCPCPWPGIEDKVEFGDGSMICASKGGYKAGETLRKIELARKGLL